MLVCVRRLSTFMCSGQKQEVTRMATHGAEDTSVVSIHKMNYCPATEGVAYQHTQKLG